MNIDHVRLFLRIAATNNISVAGKELGLSPAVASAHVTKLEDRLGVKLIHRTTRKVSLSEEGHAFLPYAEEVINSVEEARASVGAGSYTPQGRLRIAAPASFARMHLVPALKGFLAQNPDLTLDLRLSDTIIDMVEGGFDVAIRDAQLSDSTLVARKLAKDKRVICASPEYIKQHGEPKTPQDLEHHNCVNLSGLENWTFEHQGKVEKIKTKTIFRADNGEAVRDACVQGLGLTLTSTWCSYQHIERGDLVQVLGDYTLRSGTAIWAVYPSTRLLAPKVRAFIDYFNQHFGDTPFWDDAIKNSITR